MFKYINNRTERSVEATIKTLATKDDIANVRKEISEAKADTIKWMFIFWIGQIATILGVIFVFFKKQFVKEDVETFVIKDYLKEEIDGIRQDFRNAKKEMMRIMFLLAVAYELILVGALLLVTQFYHGVVTATGKTFPLKKR